MAGCALAAAVVSSASTTHAQLGGQVSAGGSATASSESEPTADGAMDSASVPDVVLDDDRRGDRALHARYRRFNTTTGATGGLHLVDAGTGAPGSFRLQLVGHWFRKSNFLHDTGSVEQSGQILSVSYTPLSFLEVFGSLGNRSTSSTGPEIGTLHTMGDVTLGVKGSYEVLPWLTLGGDLTVFGYQSLGEAGFDWSSTSVSLRALGTADLRQLPSQFPLIARTSIQYLFDNTSELLRDIERARYDSLPSQGRLPRSRESLHRATRNERFANGVNVVDQLRLGLGVEVPLRMAENFFIHPLAEWQLGIPVDRLSYHCPTGASAATPDSVDSCVSDEGFSVYPQVATLGVRVVPPVTGLSGLAAVDLGLTSTGTHVRQLAATPPYRLWFGISYDFDARPPPVRIVERRIEVPAPVAPSGSVLGSVVSAGEDERPLAGAVVRLVDSQLSASITDAEGRFVTAALEPGEYSFEVAHPDHEPATCTVAIPEEGGVVELRCELAPLPDVGALQGRVLDTWATPLAGVELRLSGEGEPQQTTSAADGRFGWESLAAGRYRIEARAEGHLVQVVQVEVQPRHTAQLEIRLPAAPAQSNLRLRNDTLVVRSPIRFEEGTAKLTTESLPLIAELADHLLRNPDIERASIGAPLDQPKGKASVYELEHVQERAESIKQALIARGVASERLSLSPPEGRRRQVELQVMVAQPQP